MSKVTLTEDRIGTVVAELTKASISRHTLALYCGASADHNPIHVDSDFAKAAGMPDVFAQGMLAMSYLGQLLNQIAPIEKHRRFSSRFQAITHLGDAIICTATLKAIGDDGGERRAVLGLTARNQAGEVKISSEAVVAL